MTVYITKKSHYKYNYLANWQNPDNGAMIGQWFTSLKELKEYCSLWFPHYVNTNF